MLWGRKYWSGLWNPRRKKVSFLMALFSLFSIVIFVETLTKVRFLLSENREISEKYFKLLREFTQAHRLLRGYGVTDTKPEFSNYNLTNLTAGQIPQWQVKVLKDPSKNWNMIGGVRHYFLTQILHLRIYKEDRAKLTIKELKQWMHYMYFAGVEHIFLCDHAQDKSELIERHLQKYISLGLLTYTPWPLPKHVVTSKLDCYTHFMNDKTVNSTWQASVDMDEYPFVVKDQTEGFLARYLQTVPAKTVQILMENYLMLGQGDRSQDMLIARVNRRTPKPANKLTKPLYRPAQTRAGMHRYRLAPYSHKDKRKHKYKTVNGDQKEILMLHYWGARVQNWGPDTKKTLDITEKFEVVVTNIAPQIMNSLLAFGEKDAFSNTTGP